MNKLKINSNLIILSVGGFYLMLILFYFANVTFWWNWANIAVIPVTIALMIVWPLFMDKKSNIFAIIGTAVLELFISFGIILFLISETDFSTFTIFLPFLFMGLMCFPFVQFFRLVKPKGYKAVLAVLAIAGIFLGGFGTFTLGPILALGAGQDTVVWAKETEDPNILVVLVDNDQGAMGGNTILMLERRELLIFKSEETIWYSGSWQDWPDVSIEPNRTIIVEGEEIKY